MVSLLFGAVWLLLAGLGFFAVRVTRSMWLIPKRVERLLRQQGIGGGSYRFPFGDIRENERCIKEANSKPIPFSHDIVPRVLPWMHRGIERYGKYFVTWLGPYPRVVINDPQLARDIISNKSGKIVKSSVHPLVNLLIRGVITYDGEKWVKHRKIINRAFQMDKLKFMSPAFLTCCTELINRWGIMVPEGGSCEIDVWIEFQNFTGDAISRTAFGSSYEEGRHIFQLLTEQTVLFVQSFRGAAIPGYRFLPTKRIRRMKEIDKEVKGLLRDLVTKREKDMQLGAANKDDLLGLLLDSNKNHCEEKQNSDFFAMTTEDIIEECRLFYLAGQETTAVLLTWTIVLLGVYQDWQERAREEVVRVFGGGQPEHEDLSQLKVVTMILHEVLRLYPPGPFFIRTAHRPIALGKFKIPSDVHFLLPVICMHQDKEIWGEDALEFKPERFAEGVSKASKNPAAYLPFSCGPRVCIGQNFAMIEAKFCLASILQHFAFELSPSYSHAPFQVLTLQPQHGAQVILRKL